MTKKESDGKELPFRLRVWSWFWVFALLLIALLYTFTFPDVQWPQTMLLILLLVVFGVPFLPYIIEFFEEINILGFSVKARKALDKVQQRQLLNQVVTTVEDDSPRWFWIDASGVAHPLPDLETAHFLTRGKGIVRVESDELKQIEPGAMPSIKLATPKHRANDIFILYNGTLYYQSSLGYLYKLAAWQEFDFGNKEIKDWDKEWLQELTPEDFIKYPVA